MKLSRAQKIVAALTFPPIVASILLSQLKTTPTCPPLTDTHFQEWREALNRNSGDPRYELATNLVSCRHFIGKSTEHIKRDFGAPDKTERFGDDINYVLGPNHGEYGFGMDHDWLTLWIENGRVTEAAITSD